jgi:uncharacterized protein YfbU (UPF0304 family)
MNLIYHIESTELDRKSSEIKESPRGCRTLIDVMDESLTLHGCFDIFRTAVRNEREEKWQSPGFMRCGDINESLK